jgi:hypothetical protein
MSEEWAPHYVNRSVEHGRGCAHVADPKGAGLAVSTTTRAIADTIAWK